MSPLNLAVSCFFYYHTPPPITSSCLFPSVFHSSTHSSCHSPPLSFCFPFSTLISHYQRCHVGEKSVLRQQRRVSLHLQRGQLNLRLLFTSKSIPPHTLLITRSQRHLQSYTFAEQSMGGEPCFHGVFI